AASGRQILDAADVALAAETAHLLDRPGIAVDTDAPRNAGAARLGEEEPRAAADLEQILHGAVAQQALRGAAEGTGELRRVVGVRRVANAVGALEVGLTAVERRELGVGRQGIELTELAAFAVDQRAFAELVAADQRTAAEDAARHATGG